MSAREKNKGVPKMNIYLLQLALIPVSFVFSRPIGKRMKEIPYPLLSHTSKIKKSLRRRSFSRTNDSFKSQAKVIVWDSVSYKHSKVLRLYETNFSCVETRFFDVTERPPNVKKIVIKRTQLATCVIIVWLTLRFSN